VFSAWSVPRGYKGTEHVVRITFRELGRVLEMAVEGDREEMARNELEYAKKTLCVI
jgi:predicted NUDIX family NTP pyrophosphohydrolase